jgi:hypothetical protein
MVVMEGFIREYREVIAVIKKLRGE